MKLTETLEDFYTIKVNGMPENLKKEIGHFNVFKLDDFVGSICKPFPYTRKDFYKISLIIGKNKVHYADKIAVIEDQALFLLIRRFLIIGNKLMKIKRDFSAFLPMLFLVSTEI